MVDQCDVARCPADVDGDEIIETRLATGGLAADGACSGAGEKQPDRTPPSDLAAGKTAARLHDLQGRGDAGSLEIAVEVVQIACNHGLHISVEGRDDGALILAKDGIHLARDRHRNAGHGGFKRRAHPSLVLWRQE